MNAKRLFFTAMIIAAGIAAKGQCIIDTTITTDRVCSVNPTSINITYTTNNVTGIKSSTGLPQGVTASYSSNMITISGVPTSSGVFAYDISLSGNTGCNNYSVTGTIWVDSMPPSTPTKTVTVCSGVEFIDTLKNAVTSTTFCFDLFDNFTVDFNPKLGNGLLGSVCGSTAIVDTFINTTSNLQTAIYTVKLMSGACVNPTPDTITVKVNPLPAVSIIGSNYICVGTTTQLSPTAGGTWISNTQGVATVTNAGVVTGVSGGTATFTFTSNATDCKNTTAAVTVNTLPTVSTTTPDTICGSGTASLRATAGNGGTTVHWYSASTGGSSIGTGSPWTTPSISGTTNYYAEAYNSTTGCVSSLRTTVTAVVNTRPTVSTTTPDTICGTGTASLRATVSSGATVRWYSASTGGSSIGTGSPWTTPSISGTTDYYAEAYNSTTGCVSASRTTVTAVVNTRPTITNDIPDTICGSGTASLRATAGNGGTTVHWYSASTGGSSIGTGSPWITPSISGTTNYYAEAYNSTTRCVSASRTAVTVTVNPVAEITKKMDTTICSGTTFTINPTNGDSSVVPTNTNYTWSVSTNSLGASNENTLKSSISQTLANNRDTAQSVAYTVTPKTGSCSGTPFTILITVKPKLKIVAASDGGDTICYGTKPEKMEVELNVPNAAYQWQDSIDGSSAWKNVANGTTATYTPPTLTTTTYYRCKIVSDCGEDTISGVIPIYVLEEVKIISISKDTNVCKNVIPNPIEVTASGGRNLTYHWEQRTTSPAWESVKGGSGGNSPTYYPPELVETTRYRCKIKSELCDTLITEPIVITVYTTLDSLSTIVAKTDKDENPYILIYPNPTAVFNYQWYRNDTLIKNATEQFYYPLHYNMEQKLKAGAKYKVCLSIPGTLCESCTEEFIPVFPLIPSQKAFTILPNPVSSGSFTVVFNRNMLQNNPVNTLGIYSSIGEKVWEQAISSLEDITIVKNMAAGVYMITLTTDNKQYSEKIIVK